MVGAVSGNSGYSYYSYGASLRTQNNPQQDLQQANAIQNERIGGSQSSGRMVGAQKAAQTGVPVQPVTPAPQVNVEGARHIDMSLPTEKAADPAELANRMRVQFAEGVKPSNFAGQIQDKANIQPAETVKNAESTSDMTKALESEDLDRGMEPAELSARMRVQYADSAVQGVNGQEGSVNPASQSAEKLEGPSTENVKNLSREADPAPAEDEVKVQYQEQQQEQNARNIENKEDESVPAFAAA